MVRVIMLSGIIVSGKTTRIIILSVSVQNVVTFSDTRQSVIMLNVVAPSAFFPNIFL